MQLIKRDPNILIKRYASELDQLDEEETFQKIMVAKYRSHIMDKVIRELKTFRKVTGQLSRRRLQDFPKWGRKFRDPKHTLA